MAKYTMQQIADELGVSRFTVSAVINGYAERRGISQATIKRVQAHVARTAFVPSLHARALKSGQRSSVGILHCGDLGRHLIKAFNLLTVRYHQAQGGVEIMMCRPQEVVTGLQELMARGIHQLIWIHGENPQVELFEHEHLLSLLSKVPAVLYNYHFTESDMDERLTRNGVYLVGVSRKKGYQKLAAFIKSLGHRDIYLPDVWAHEGITAGVLSRQFAQAFEAEGLTPHPSLLERAPHDAVTQGLGLVEPLYQAWRSGKITAACFRDDTAAGVVIAGLREKGVSIPQQLTITSFDDHPLAPFFQVPLTTVRMPVVAMVERTVMILETQPRRYRHCLELELVQRRSHAPAARPQGG